MARKDISAGEKEYGMKFEGRGGSESIGGGLKNGGG